MDVDRLKTSFLAISKSNRGRWLSGIVLAIVYSKRLILFNFSFKYEYINHNLNFVSPFLICTQHEYRDGTTNKEKKSKRRKKDKDSDGEDDATAPLLEPEKIENIKENFTGSVTPNQEAATVEEQSSPAVGQKSVGLYAAEGDDANETKK